METNDVLTGGVSGQRFPEKSTVSLIMTKFRSSSERDGKDPYLFAFYVTALS